MKLKPLALGILWGGYPEFFDFEEYWISFLHEACPACPDSSGIYRGNDRISVLDIKIRD